MKRITTKVNAEWVMIRYLVGPKPDTSRARHFYPLNFLLSSAVYRTCLCYSFLITNSRIPNCELASC